jgi:hypothetical protein
VPALALARALTRRAALRLAQALPQRSAAQKKRLQIHPAGLLITLLSFGAWVVALGGVGGATQNCVNGGISSATSANPQASVQCAKIYQWEWWGLWFEAGLLVSLFVSSFFEAFNRGKQVFIAYFIMCTNVLMYSAHNFITNSQLGSTGWKISDKQQVRPDPRGNVRCAPHRGATLAPHTPPPVAASHTAAGRSLMRALRPPRGRECAEVESVSNPCPCAVASTHARASLRRWRTTLARRATPSCASSTSASSSSWAMRAT